MGQLRWLVTVVSCLVVFPAGDVRGDDQETIRAFLRAYADAFNGQDLDAVGAMWTENGVHVDRETEERTEGRAAIRADLAAVFERAPKPRLEGDVDRVWLIRPDVASVEGTTTITVPDSPPTASRFSAILVNNGQIWQIASVEETPVPQPMSAGDVLPELAWLEGSWVDDSDDAPAVSTFRWSANGSFLIRSCSMKDGDEAVPVGTQIIGWDPRSQQIRSWTFNSDGSFGDGIWTKAGNDWLIKSTQTLLDGRAAFGTYVITPVDDDTLTLRLIGQEIEGEPVPRSDPIVLLRVRDSVPDEVQPTN
jgi:uncharacterized protein (TIGR02246 family)